MKKVGFAVFSAIFLVALVSCLSTPVGQAGAPANRAITPAAPPVRSAAQPVPAVQPVATQPASPYFSGDGGSGIRLAVLVPDAVGLPTEQDYLPTLVQGVLVGDLARFSAISVLDRQRLESVLTEIESGIYQTEEDFGRLGEIANVDYVLTGSITRTATGHALQIQIVGTGRGNIGITRASFSGTPTIAEMDDFTGIRRASMDLLTQMGVNLTANARQELGGAATASRISGETALARGIVAHRQGTEVAALSYYFQAAAFDPTLLEAVNRSSILHASISSGNIGDDVRNEIAWRRDWIERLTETEQFFADFHQRESMPYTLFYTVDITQGAINWQTETVNLSILTHLHGSGIWTVSIERALQAVYDGLRATGRAQAWGLGNWPRQGVTNLNAFARRSNNFSVVFELLNDQDRVIGRQTLQTGGYWGLSWAARPSVSVNASDRRTLTFQNVNANDITDRMSIRVVSVNGMAAETAARSGVLQIRATTRNEFARNDVFRFERGEVRGFASNAARTPNISIPNYIWGDPVISIGSRAFERTGLASVFIPSGVTSIGANAFANNQLINVTIPNSVTSIGANAFANNRLIIVTIPNNSTSIGANAFVNNRADTVEGFSVTLSSDARSLMITGFVNNAARDARIVVTPASFTAGLLGRTYHPREDRLVIPNAISGVPVTSIGARAFRDIGVTHVIIPSSITYIGEEAFGRNPLASVTIGANVAMAESSFLHTWRNNDGRISNHPFSRYYAQNGRRAGTYVFPDVGRVFTTARWVYRSQ